MARLHAPVSPLAHLALRETGLFSPSSVLKTYYLKISLRSKALNNAQNIQETTGKLQNPGPRLV
jgi:hypothetical protein